MEVKIRKNYNDKWKKFVKKVIKNIDYLSYDMPDIIIDDIFYQFETVLVPHSSYLFKKGTTCSEI